MADIGTNPIATTVPVLDPDQSESQVPNKQSPYSALWWTTQTITNIPEASVGWLVAQGWQITATAEDNSTVPATVSYSMSRQSLQNWLILQSLLNSYTTAWNTAKEMNEYRYNEVVANWHSMLSTSETHFTTQTTAQNTQVALYLGNLDSYMDTIEALVTANQTSMDDAVAAVVSRVGEATALMTAHDSIYGVVVDEFLSDYNWHAVEARSFLTGLGTTELARINEQFTATLTTQLQQLVDRGLSSSSVITDITARNTRDKNEEIATLNDRLNREKLENQHRLFGQQVAMRGRTLDGKDRLHTLKQELLRFRIAQELGNAEAVVSHKHKAVTELMTTYAARLEGLRGMHDDNMKLMAYQLSERNNILVGLYGFVERRTDEYPKFEELTKIAVGLADSGGGWVTP